MQRRSFERLPVVSYLSSIVVMSSLRARKIPIYPVDDYRPSRRSICFEGENCYLDIPASLRRLVQKYGRMITAISHLAETLPFYAELH